MHNHEQSLETANTNIWFYFICCLFPLFSIIPCYALQLIEEDKKNALKAQAINNDATPESIGREAELMGAEETVE